MLIFYYFLEVSYFIPLPKEYVKHGFQLVEDKCFVLVLHAQAITYLLAPYQGQGKDEIKGKSKFVINIDFKSFN